MLDVGLAHAGFALYGAYLLAACLWEIVPARKALFLTVASCSALFSCYLLYVLKFILGDFCIVCTGFHITNFSMREPWPLTLWPLTLAPHPGPSPNPDPNLLPLPCSSAPLRSQSPWPSSSIATGASPGSPSTSEPPEARAPRTVEDPSAMATRETRPDGSARGAASRAIWRGRTEPLPPARPPTVGLQS